MILYSNRSAKSVACSRLNVIGVSAFFFLPALVAAFTSADEFHSVTNTRWPFAVKPDLAVYFRVPIDVSVDRLLARRVKLKFYEAGMDLGWSTNPVESFRLFQGKVLDEYDRIVEEFGLDVVNAVGTITDQQRLVRDLIAKHVHTTHVTDHVETLDEQPV